MKENKEQKKESRFLKFLFPESPRRSWKIIKWCTIVALLIGLFFETHPIFGGKIFTLAFSEWMKSDKRNLVFAFYQILLYAAVAGYAASAMYILSKKKTVEWCSLVIGISIIFVLFINVYLTLMLNATQGKNLYPNYVISFSSISTIICAVAGVKMTRVLEKPYKRRKHRKNNSNPSNQTSSPNNEYAD